MPSLQIPGSLCATLHPDYIGPDSPPQIINAIVLAARAMVTQAVTDGLAPGRVPTTHDPGITRNVSFPSSINDAIEDYAFDHDVQASHAIRAFLYAAIARGDAANHCIQPVDDLRPYTKAMSFERRPEQTQLFANLTDCLGTGRVGLIEGATGVGKTLAIVAAAAEITSTEGRAVVSAPTLQILREFISTHAKLAKALPQMPQMRVVFGRQEYISQKLLVSALDEGEVAVDAAPIRRWLADGAPPVGPDEMLGQPYLCSSLRQVSPEFPVEGVQLSAQTPEDDPGHVTYRSQFERDEDEPAREIIYCSHAMVAVDLRHTLNATWSDTSTSKAREEQIGRIKALAETRSATLKSGLSKKMKRDALKAVGQQSRDERAQLTKLFADTVEDSDVGFLPPWQHIIIDEAHTFENNLANTLATNLSLMEFARAAREAAQNGFITENAAKRVAGALRTLRTLAHQSTEGLDLNAISNSASQQARAALAEAAGAICNAKLLTSEPSSLLRRLKKDAATIKQALLVISKGASRTASLLRFSPVREFPQLCYGRRSVESELAFLWARSTGAACVSATLYLRRIDRFSADYMAGILRIPRERLSEYAPIRPRWSVSPVCGLWTPEAIEGWLRPPSRSDRLDKPAHEAASKRWHAELARELARIHAGDPGGTLVLMTGYDAVREVAALISPEIDALVQANPRTTLDAQRALFMKLAKEGRRPMWLALGGAWTGLDVNGQHLGLEAQEDNLLTTLVIARLPFNLNKSLTHAHRMESMPRIPWELLDTTMRVKQGLGRLVRREGLPNNRRIFVLDGRLNDPRFESFLGPIKTLLAAYPGRVWNRDEMR